MNRITIEALHDDPELGRRLQLAAHRERALATRAVFAWLRGQAGRFLPRRIQLNPKRWTECLG